MSRNKPFTQLVVAMSREREVTCRFRGFHGGTRHWPIVTDAFLRVAKRLSRESARDLRWPEGEGQLGRGTPVVMDASLFARVYATWLQSPKVRDLKRGGEVAVVVPKALVSVLKKARAQIRAQQHVA